CLWSPTIAVRWAAQRTIGLCFLIELSQLCQADWLNAIRQTRLGAIVLGFGFLWSDLACYICGAGVAALIDRGCLVSESNFSSVTTSTPDIMEWK
ncbi:MAG TPA: DUF2809 domain-containing protein, partial [Candidatus Ozemobacteraceae bacterium]|nr:DUF2809 domain-containing protein [Candidatus Ozemobacteraceae bacterium]